MILSKVCTKCQVEKPFTEFYKRKETKDGKCSSCRDCKKAAAKTVPPPRKRTREERRQPSRKAYCKKRFGITPQEYDDHLAKHDNCEMCTRPFVEGVRKCLDHNHNTQEIRGVLCTTCNQGIGLLQDDPAIVQAAYIYLTQRGYYGGPNRTGQTTSRREKTPTDGFRVVC